MGRLKRAVTRAQYAAMGAAVGAGVGGLISRSAASTGGATGALAGALVGEFRARAEEEGGVAGRLSRGDDDSSEGIEKQIRSRLDNSLPDRD
jgi:osmotically inducible lipoprotein OsmB